MLHGLSIANGFSLLVHLFCGLRSPVSNAHPYGAETIDILGPVHVRLDDSETCFLYEKLQEKPYDNLPWMHRGPALEPISAVTCNL